MNPEEIKKQIEEKLKLLQAEFERFLARAGRGNQVVGWRRKHFIPLRESIDALYALAAGHVVRDQ